MMTADRVIVLILMALGAAGLVALNRRKLARMSSEERVRFDRNLAPVTGFLKAFLWFWVIADAGAGIAAAGHGAWPVAVALFVVAAGIAYGLCRHSR